VTSRTTLGPESPDGRFVYFTKAGPIPRFSIWGLFSLWRRPIEAGPERQVLEILGRDDFALASGGVYYIAVEGPKLSQVLKFHDFATGKSSTISPITKGTASGLAVSPDGRSVLYTQADRETSDPVLVENFR
jgi:hypothetical protein